MSYVVVNFRKSKPDAKVPTRATEGSAGWDLYAVSDGIPTERDPYIAEYSTGINVEIPAGYVGLIFPRSSICKTSLSLVNSVGVIDSDYRGEIKFFFRSQITRPPMRAYKAGDRIGQLIIIPQLDINFVEVEQLSETNRGEGGFGSTGRGDLLSTGCEWDAEKEVLLTANPDE